MKATFAVLPCLLLAACQMTTFEKPPLVATRACDPVLMGRWESVDENARPGAPPEMALELDGACNLQVEEFKNGGVQRGEPTRLQLSRVGDYGYAWVDARWAMRRFDEKHEFPAGDIVLLRWQVDGDTLKVWNFDDRHVAHAIIDGDLTGQVEAADSELYNRLTGDQDPSVLERAGMYDAEPGVFHRVPDRPR